MVALQAKLAYFNEMHEVYLHVLLADMGWVVIILRILYSQPDVNNHTYASAYRIQWIVL